MADLGVDFDGVQNATVALGVAELYDAEFDGVVAVGGDDGALVEFETVVVYFFHDVVDEEVLFEFFAQDEYFVFGFDAVVAVHAPNQETFGKDAGVGVHQDGVVFLLGFYISFEGSQVLLDFEYFEVGVFFLLLFDEVEHGY